MKSTFHPIPRINDYWWNILKRDVPFLRRTECVKFFSLERFFPDTTASDLSSCSEIIVSVPSSWFFHLFVDLSYDVWIVPGELITALIVSELICFTFLIHNWIWTYHIIICCAKHQENYNLHFKHLYYRISQYIDIHNINISHIYNKRSFLYYAYFINNHPYYS